MTEETYTFEQAHARLEEIAKQAKGASLEQCLDLLEEGVKLANVCTDRIDHTRWRDEVDPEGQDSEAVEGEEAAQPSEQAEDSAETDGDPAEPSAETDEPGEEADAVEPDSAT